VTIEFISDRPPSVTDFSSAEDAQRCIETAKQNQKAWHIFHSVQKTLTGQHLIELSLYRWHETREWRGKYQMPEQTKG